MTDQFPTTQFPIPESQIDIFEMLPPDPEALAELQMSLTQSSDSDQEPH